MAVPNRQLYYRCVKRLLSLLLLIAPTVDAADVPAYVIELPAAVGDVFVADTSAATMYRFRTTPAGVELAHQSYLSIGENGAGKRRAWDRKTPLGVYFVVDELDVSRLHEKYGVAAFPLDYPNTWDRRHERTGDGIWLHGVLPGGERRPTQDTDGCLALPNEDISLQADNVVPLVTPVIVTPEMDWRPASDVLAIREELRALLAEWTDAQSSLDMSRYLSLYSETFSYRGMNYREWLAFRAQTLSQHHDIEVALSELVLLQDPVEDELYLARFRHTVTTESGTSVTTKRLYWQRQEDGKLAIVAEDNG